MSTADGGLALQWADNGTADHNWEIVTDGTAVRLRNVNSGKVLGVENMSTADNARVLQWADNGTADHRWTLVDDGDGSHKIRNVNSGKLLGHPERLHRQRRAGRAGLRQRQRRTTGGGSSPTAPGGSRTWPAAWCSACRTCPPPTAAW